MRTKLKQKYRDRKNSQVAKQSSLLRLPSFFLIPRTHVHCMPTTYDKILSLSHERYTQDLVQLSSTFRAFKGRLEGKGAKG